MQLEIDHFTDQLQTILKKSNRPELADQIDSMKSDSGNKDGNRVIAIIGEFGRGKSTLLNALLNRIVLPMGGTPTSNTLQIVKKSQEDRGIVHFTDGTLQNICPKLDILTQYITTSECPVSYFELQLKGEVIPDGIQIIEPPGLGDINPEHMIVTHQVIARACAVIFVIDANMPLNQSEMNALATLPIHIKHLMIVINQAEKLNTSEREQVTEYVEKQIERLKLSIKPDVFTLSARTILEKKHEISPLDDNIWNRLITVLTQWQNTIDIVDRIASNRYILIQLIDNLIDEMMIPESIEEKFSIHQSVNSDENSSQIEQKHHVSLILKIIEDQEADILQIVRDRIENNAYILKDKLKKKLRNVHEIPAIITDWIETEEAYIEKRLSRLIKRIDDEMNIAQKQIYTNKDFHLNHFDKEQLSIPQYKQSSISTKRIASSIAGGTALSVTLSTILLINPAISLFSGFLGGVSIWTLLKKFEDSTDYDIFLDNISEIILTNIQTTIHKNIRRLKEAIRVDILQLDQKEKSSNHSKSQDDAIRSQEVNEHYDLLSNLYAIRRELEALKD